MGTNWTILKAVFLGLVCLAVFTTTAQANRRASLADNLLIEDKDDVFLFPQRLLDYRNSVGVDMGLDGRSGRVLFLSGWEDLGLGFSAEQVAPHAIMAGPIPPDLITYQTDALYMGPVSPNPLGTPLSPFNPFPLTSVSEAFVAVAPFTLIDAFLAIPAGDGAFGLRLGFGTRGVSGTFQDAVGDDVDSGVGETLITLEAGLSGGTDARFDASLNLALDLSSGENGTLINPITGGAVSFDEVSGTLIRASLSGRGYLPYTDNIDIGVLGNIVFTTTSITPQVLDTEFTMSNLGFGVMGGAGPVFHVTELVQIAAYGLLGITLVSTDPDDESSDDPEYTDLVIYVPGVRVAGDIGITEWFFFRTGVQYSFQFASTSYGDDQSGRRGDGLLGWTVGIGFEYEGFTLDGTLNQAWMTSGPDFIGGDPSSLFSVVSAGYHWL